MPSQTCRNHHSRVPDKQKQKQKARCTALATLANPGGICHVTTFDAPKSAMLFTTLRTS